MVRVCDIRTFDNFIMALPAQIDPAKYRAVIVWCEADDDATAREKKTVVGQGQSPRCPDSRVLRSAGVAAAPGNHADRAQAPRGRLALIPLFDQFPRNMHRGSARAFAFNALTQRLAMDDIGPGANQGLRPIERVFFHLPLEHSESLDLRKRCVELFRRLSRVVLPQQHELFRGHVQYAERHRDIIARFGRFPLRNTVLGRASAPQEMKFQMQPGSSF
ncbi:MAG: DUF924 family protein [Betaproteobacteria bacterium]|jgi:uncharacterized protein (DUF924 family)